MGVRQPSVLHIDLHLHLKYLFTDIYLNSQSRWFTRRPMLAWLYQVCTGGVDAWTGCLWLRCWSIDIVLLWKANLTLQCTNCAVFSLSLSLKWPHTFVLYFYTFFLSLSDSLFYIIWIASCVCIAYLRRDGTRMHMEKRQASGGGVMLETLLQIKSPDLSPIKHQWNILDK